MATSSFKTIPVCDIYADYGRNVRQTWKYRVEPKKDFNPEDKKAVPGFYEDILMAGVRVPITVSELEPNQIDRLEKKIGRRVKFRVIRGHRRFKAVEMVLELNPGIKGFEELTCEVFSGLSEADEIVMMCDHSGTEPLNEFEEFCSVERLYGTALSQEAIGLQIGRSRAWVQDRIYVLELTRFLPEIRDAYSKRFEPEAKKFVNGYVPFTMKDVDQLHKAWTEDTKAGIPADSPSSKTAALWRALREQKQPEATAPKALGRDKMDKLSGFIKGREALELMEMVYNGTGGNIMAATEAYDALVTKAGLVPALQSEVAALKAQIADLNRLVAEKDSEIVSLKSASTKKVGK